MALYLKQQYILLFSMMLLSKQEKKIQQDLIQGVYNSGNSGKTQGKKKTQGTQGKLREFETYSGNFYEQRK